MMYLGHKLEECQSQRRQKEWTKKKKKKSQLWRALPISIILRASLINKIGRGKYLAIYITT